MARLLTRRDLLISATGISFLVGSRGRIFADSKSPGVVNGQLQAAEAGKLILENGGNAVDAIVAGALAAGVVAIPLTGIGGYGGHMIVSTPTGKVSAIDFNTVAPASMTEDIYKADSKGAVKNEINALGWKAVGVPGVLAGLQRARDLHGTKSMAELLQPAIGYANEGFVVPKNFASQLLTHAERLVKDPGSAKLLFKDGKPIGEGAVLKNPDLGRMLKTLADRNSVASFYKGDIADQISDAFRKNEGWVTGNDLSAYRAIDVTPLSLDWHNQTIYTPPPSSAGITVLQTVAILKALGWPGSQAAVARSKYYLEAMRIAWTDRLELVGDPTKIKVPVQKLLSEEYARESAKRVRFAVESGKPVDAHSDGRPAGGTIHLNAIDANGLTAAMTFTHGGYFGAQVTVDGLGLVLGQGLSRFDPRPGRANSPRPGKRPLHNMCPTIVLKDGHPVLAVGATGGRRIVNAVTRAVSAYVGESLTVSDAVAAPRIHTEGDLLLTLDAKHPAKDDFKKIGYMVTEGTVATLTALGRDSRTNQLTPAAR